MSIPDPADGERTPMRPTSRQLFFGFLAISSVAFGGVLPWAQREIVERRNWLTLAEFAELLGICQFLPGPNIMNLGIAIGARFRGWRGSLAAMAGLMGLPFVLVLTLGVLYDRYGDHPAIAGAIAGIAAAAAGLLITMVWKLLVAIHRSRGGPSRYLVVLAAFVAVGVLQWPLGWCMVGLLVFSLGLAEIERRRPPRS
ncbi:chromate transporter [soil metagenome]